MVLFVVGHDSQLGFQVITDSGSENVTWEVSKNLWILLIPRDDAMDLKVESVRDCCMLPHYPDFGT